uniref:Cysteine protease, putative n=1 Tax=Theileria annulata TaxID=5874 RepID=A0A3B0MQ69_THEAN
MDTIDVEQYTYNHEEVLNKKKKFRIRLAIAFTIVLILLGLTSLGIFFAVNLNTKAEPQYPEQLNPQSPVVQDLDQNEAPVLDVEETPLNQKGPVLGLEKFDAPKRTVNKVYKIKRGRPSAPVLRTPKEPKVNTPVQPRVYTPVEPKIKTPTEPKINTPTEPKVNTPVEPKNNTPTEPKLKTPIAPKLKKLTDYVKPLEKKPTYKKPLIEELREHMEQKNVKELNKTFEECGDIRCPFGGSNVVYEWELEYITEALKDFSPINVEKELETILKYREFRYKYSKFYTVKRNYMNSYLNFRQNRAKIENHNKDPKRLYNMEYTYFADTPGSMSSSAPGANPSDVFSSKTADLKLDLTDQEIHVDWRESGFVNEVVNQGSCGSCWAIASEDIFSTFKSIKKNKLMKFSSQQLVDCVSPLYTCEKGGVHRKGLQYIKDNEMCTQEEYPYMNKKNKCTSYKCEHKSDVKDIVSLHQNDALEHLKKNGPFLTLFRVSLDFLLYKDGIFNGSCMGKEAHSIVVVGHGYDKVKKVNYWIVKNSWGKEFGEQGYFRILDAPNSPVDNANKYCDFLLHSFGIV